MHVFVTGATGWVGSVVVRELIEAGHKVTGLVRSREKVAGLDATGATPLEGTLDDLDLIRRAAEAADAVVHTAFNHDFSKFADNAAQDRLAIEVLGEALEGSGRPLLVTSGLANLAPGRLATEEDMPSSDPSYPRRSEAAAQALAERGVNVATVRLAPTVHGIGDHGFVPILIDMARQTGVSAYLDDGQNRWSAVHRVDAGRLYRLVLEKGITMPAYHAVAEESIAFREIAEMIGRQLGVPVEPRGREHFGWFAGFAASDMPASAKLTMEALDWAPTQPTLIEDLGQLGYFQR